MSYSKVNKKYQARIQVNGKPIRIGYYNTAQQASEAYKIEAKKSFGKFYNEEG